MHKDLCHEANETQDEGPFAYMSPFQSPRRGFQKSVSWSYVFVKCARVRYFNHNCKEYCLFPLRPPSDTIFHLRQHCSGHSNFKGSGKRKLSWKYIQFWLSGIYFCGSQYFSVYLCLQAIVQQSLGLQRMYFPFNMTLHPSFRYKRFQIYVILVVSHMPGNLAAIKDLTKALPYLVRIIKTFWTL